MQAPSNLEVIQINLQHSRSASAILCRCLAKLQTSGVPVIALIQEPWIYKNQVKGLSSLGGQILRGAPRARVRACIYVSKGLDMVFLPHLSSSDISAVEVDLMVGGRKRTIVFISAYLPQDPFSEPPPSRELALAISSCEQRQIPIIIGCDANAHHTVWGCQDINIRGRTLLEYLMTTDLEIINQGHSPTYVGMGHQSIIDLTLASQQIAGEVLEWHVSREDSMSDHRHIYYHLQIDAIAPVYRRNPRSTDWGAYKRNLENRIGDWVTHAQDSNDLEQGVNNLQTAIITSYEESCPLRRVKMGRRVPWWNQRLSELRKECRKNLRRALYSRADQDWEIYKEFRREYKNLIQKSKQKSWRDFCEEIEGVKPSSRLNRVLTKDPTVQIGMMELPNGDYTESREDALAHLLEVHFPGSIESEELHAEQGPWPGIQYSTQVSRNLALQIVTEDRVKWAIKTFSPYKTAGPDKIFPALLQQGLDQLVKPLITIFRASIAMAYIPIAWRRVRVVFIAKPGKDSYARAKSFRPISLSSFMLKGLERLADRWIREGALQRIPLHPSQHAYQAGKSAETALHNLVGRVEKALEDKEFALGAFFDIAGAFDNAQYESFEKALRKRRVEQTLISWIRAMLCSRSVEAQMGECRKAVAAQRGCPQGGVLSPLLWSLLMDSLVKGLNGQHLTSQAYADDGVVLIVGKFLDVVCGLMQRALDYVQRWCHEEGLSVQPEKLELVLFTKRRNLIGFQAPSMYGEQLMLSHKVKYLGVYLDTKLTWKDHMDTKCKRACAAFCQARRAVGRTWGLSPKVVRWLYIAVIRPMLTFAAVVWWPRTELGIAQMQLGRVQRLACLCITGAVRTTPTAAMEVLLALPSLHIHIRMEAMATSYRMSTVNQWNKGNVGHKRIWGLMRDISPLHQFRSDHIIPQFLFDKDYDISFPKREDWLNNLVSIPENSLLCYTDGSRLTDVEQSGAGVHIVGEDFDESMPLGQYATVFQAEMFAILSCARKIEASGCQNKTIIICSDSQAALKALVSSRVTSRLTLDCAEDLQRLARRNTLQLKWIPAHSGLGGNEEADRLAREASQLPFIGPEPVLGTSPTLIRSSLRKWAQKQLHAGWTMQTACRQAKQLIPGPRLSFSWKLLNLDRRRMRLIVGLLTGHCTLNRHLNIMRVVTDPTCPLCLEEEETTFHTLGCCEALGGIRHRILGNRYLEPQDIHQLNIADLLRFCRISGRF